MESQPENGGNQKFQFIDASPTSKEHKARNLTITRSHVMRGIRAGRRTKPQLTRQGSQSTQHIRSSPVAARITQRSTRDSFIPNYRLMVHYDLPALQMFEKPTPHLRMFIDYFVKDIWPVFSPPVNSTEISPLSMDWLLMARSSPALLHASICFAAAHIDSQESTQLFKYNAELIAHKVEAIRQINLGLNASNLPDAIILAIMAMAREPEETESERTERLAFDMDNPFKTFPMPPQWNENFTRVTLDDAHFKGVRAIVEAKGGISTIKSPCAAKSFSHYDLREAALKLRAPYYRFYELPEIAIQAKSPMLNVLPQAIVDSRGCGFSALVSLGLTEEALEVLLDMVNFTAMMEAYAHYTLVNPSLLPLISQRNELHHRLLSLPTNVVLSEPSGRSLEVYECCRLGAMIFAIATLFPLPRSTNCLRQLVLQFKSIVENLSLERLAFAELDLFIWAFFIAGIGAEKTPERLWFVERLQGLLDLKNMTRWVEIKALVECFLWTNVVCDEGAMKLWDEVASGRR